jgi:hypothetical protein
MPTAISTARLEARISTDLHSMLKRAAELQGRTMVRLKGPPAKGFPGSQPNTSGSPVASTRPAVAMESHPQGAAGSTPKGGQPRSAMAVVLLFVTL